VVLATKFCSRFCSVPFAPSLSCLIADDLFHVVLSPAEDFANGANLQPRDVEPRRRCAAQIMEVQVGDAGRLVRPDERRREILPWPLPAAGQYRARVLRSN
jgi:hypothetical protein